MKGGKREKYFSLKTHKSRKNFCLNLFSKRYYHNEREDVVAKKNRFTDEA
jgi:hypothetical protein